MTRSANEAPKVSSRLIESKGTFWPMLRLATPVVAEQMLFVSVMLTDVWLTGHFIKQPSALAAIALMAYAMWFTSSMFEFVCSGATAMVARFTGAGDSEKAQRVAQQSLLAGLVLALFVTVFGLAGASTYVSIMQLEGTAAELGVRYLWIVLPTLPLVMILRVGIASLRGAGDMITVFWVMAIVNAVNVVVSCALVIGVGPIPAMGWEGIAIGTAAAHVVGGSLVFSVLLIGKSGLRYRWERPRLDRDIIRRLLRIGIPGGLDTLAVILCHHWFLSIINNLGDVEAGAHGLAVRIESLAFMPGAGFAMAAMTMAGQFLGARDPHRAGRSVLMACLIGGTVMTSMGAVFFFAGDHLVALFIDPTQIETSKLTVQLLRIVAWAMLPLSLLMILSGALRGAGDTRWPLAFTLIGFVGIRIPLAYYLAWHLELGAVGAWYAMLFECHLRCGMVLYRFFHGGWKKIEI